MPTVISDTMVAEAQLFKNKDFMKISPVLDIREDCYSTSSFSPNFSVIKSSTEFLNLKLNYSDYMLFKLFHTATIGIYQ